MKFLFRECYPDERSWSIEKKPSSACRNPFPQMFLSMRKTIVHMLVTNRLYVIIGIVPRFLPYDLRNKSKRKRRMDTESPCLTHATHRRRIILPELFLHDGIPNLPQTNRYAFSTLQAPPLQMLPR